MRAYWVPLLLVAMLAACAPQPRLPEVVGESHQLPYGGSIRATYWGALKSDPDWYIVEMHGKLFHVYGQAVRPSIQSAFLLENTVINAGEDVLDLGTGSGIQAIFAAQSARRVVATDIGPDAVRSAQFNVKAHGMQDKIDVRQGDLFAPLRQDEKFDVIINNIEYPENDPDSPLWEVHRRFFAQVGNFLQPHGRILYQSGSIANMPLVAQLARDNGYYVVEAHMRAQSVQAKELVFYVIRRRLG